MDRQMDNEVVGVVNNIVIVQREDGTLYYVDIPENMVRPGDTVLDRDLKSIHLLPTTLQNKIIDMFGGD